MVIIKIFATNSSHQERMLEETQAEINENIPHIQTTDKQFNI